MIMSKVTTAASTAVRQFVVDPSHSEVHFQVRHLLTRVRGRFSSFEGDVQYDAAQPEQSAARFVIQAASIDTNEAKRDAHLRSADFFETDTYPTLSFVSGAIQKVSGDRFDIHGDLTIHGVTRPVVLQATLLGTASDPWGNERLAIEAETTINRKDFGLNWNAALETGGFLVGDDVKIEVSLQAVAK
jgi:polyisoprenoid-binding protein YceI